MKRQNLLFGLITLALLLFVINGVSAQDYFSHKLNTNLSVVINSNNATECNITSIQYPDGSASLNDFIMEKSGQSFNYTVDSSNFSKLGDICFNINCNDGVSNEPGSVCRTITPNGVVQTTAQGLGGIGFLGLMIILTIMFAWIGFRLSESEYLWVVGIFFLFLSVLFIVYDVWLGYEYHRNFTGNTDSGLPETIFYIFMFLVTAGFLVSLALLFTKWKKLVKYIKKQIKDKDYALEQDEIDREFQ